MVNQHGGATLDPLQACERRPVGRGVTLHLRDVTPVAGGRDVRSYDSDSDFPSPVTRHVLEAYVAIARQMSAYVAARPR